MPTERESPKKIPAIKGSGKSTGLGASQNTISNALMNIGNLNSKKKNQPAY